MDAENDSLRNKQEIPINIVTGLGTVLDKYPKAEVKVSFTNYSVVSLQLYLYNPYNFICEGIWKSQPISNESPHITQELKSRIRVC